MSPEAEGGARRAFPLYQSEFVGTAILVLVGCSFVVVDFGATSPVPALLPDPGLRRAITGFLFGSLGALLAVSRVGKVSGAHLNPTVTLFFWLEGRLKGKVALGYVAGQLTGATLGALPLLLWGDLGRSVSFGATLVGPDGELVALLGEMLASFCLIALLCLFLGHARLRAYTPLLFPVLFAVLTWSEAPLSGASTNAARSLGPGIVSGELTGYWIYLLGPVLGTLGALGLRRGWPWARGLEIRVAKVFHFDHDAYGIFSEKSVPSQPPTEGQ
jgi:aquaporin Z